MLTKIYGSLFLVLILSGSLAFASGDYSVLEGYPVGRCRLASNKAGKAANPLPRESNCSINVNYYYTGYPIGFEIAPPIPYCSSCKAISFWIERYSSKDKKWVKISSSGKIARNGVTKQINFKPKFSGKFRVAFDIYYMSFADEYASEFSLAIK